MVPAESTMVASVRYLGSIHARAEFYTPSEIDAKKLADQASAFLTLFKSIEINAQTANDPDLKSALESLKIEQLDSRAILSATIPAGFFKKILEEPPVDVTGTKQDQAAPARKEQPAAKPSTSAPKKK